MKTQLRNQEELQAAFKRNDEEALREVVFTYREPLRRFIRQFVNDEHLAEDLCQETFIKLLKNLDRFEADGNFQNWIYTIARNVALDYLRQRKRDRAVFVDELEAEYTSNPMDHVLEEEETEALSEAMVFLSDREREAFVSKEGEDKTFREIGDRLECTISHVRTLIYHAKTILRNNMANFCELPKAG